jgi:hypothetical protein
MSKFLALSSMILAAGFIAAQSAPSYTPPDPGPPPVRALPPSLDTVTGPLSPVTLSKLSPEEMRRPAAPHQRRVGVDRALPNDLIARGKWLVAPTSTGVKTTWRVEILDPSALGLRVHFKGYNGQGGLLWAHSGNATDPQFAGPFSDRGTFHDGDFWTEVIFGEKIVIEYQAPEGRDPSGAPPFQIAQLIHIFEFMGKSELSPAAGSIDTSCELDAACYTNNANVVTAASTVVYLIIGGSQCTGTMINDKSSSFRPWMLTAGHCVTSDADARATTAYAGFQNKFCNSTTNYATLPSATGGTLLQQQFTTPGKTDFAFLELSAIPGSTSFSGWDASVVKSGENMISISNPRNLSNRFANLQAIQVGSTQVNVNLTQGRVDHGSSGSAAFDFATGNYIRGVLSSIANDESVSACALPSPFSANYTEFSTIFPSIDSYLSSTVPPVQTVTFTANPNPIPVAGQKTTLSWNAPGHNSLVIKIGNIAMTGTVGTNGTADTGTWVTDGMVFTLIDTVTGATVSSLTVKVGSGGNPTGTPTLTANPNPIPSAGQITKLTWNAPGFSNLVIRVGSPTGPAMTGPIGSTGTADTGPWVTDGMTFYLIDNASGKSIASVAVKVGSTPTGTLSFTASPNPIHTNQAVGTTTLNWNAPGHQVIIRVNSATGVAMTGVLPSNGSTPTGNWVSNGMKFFLVDASSGATLASLTVTLSP